MTPGGGATQAHHGSDPEVAVVAALAEEVFAAVESVRSQAVQVCSASMASRNHLEVSDISALRGRIRSRLHGRESLLLGLGLVVAPGILSDERFRLEWWQRAPGEVEPSAVHADLNTLSSGFYDYEAAEWFDVPRRTGERHIAGPHVDVGCSGRYLLTFTAPVVLDGQFLGVAGADVALGQLEDRLLRDVVGRDGLIVLNGDARVVFSTSTSWLAGDRCDDSGLVSGFAAITGLPWCAGKLLTS